MMSVLTKASDESTELNAVRAVNRFLRTSRHRLANTKAVISSEGGFAPGQSNLGTIAIDQSGKAWAPGIGTVSVIKINPDGSFLTCTGGGVKDSDVLAIDGFGIVWASWQ